MESTEMTVGDLIDRLSACDHSAPVRHAMNPFFAMAHRLEQVVQVADETGQAVVYLAEGWSEDTQLGHLPHEVAVQLAWQAPVQAPPRRPRRTAGGK
ncbi:hypothetical protein [Streptomyces diastatochromogenes]|uniref:Uncharacterized protein n=1 Tax=Streptomyces diastatochromogenes TaxID=42236 RepID=A0A233SCS0_STRDA|nr:hypothetical protein [Streptomyces diastatochromogenes]MCZ0990379.1 hypothetical protein [Streptomyces diastatochromogenes]OXY93441.1 hypothetical protein BEK98_22270 [Streptomyces diastatochromogenes]